VLNIERPYSSVLLQYLFSIPSVRKGKYIENEKKEGLENGDK